MGNNEFAYVSKITKEKIMKSIQSFYILAALSILFMSCSSLNKVKNVEDFTLEENNLDENLILQNFEKQEECWNKADIECYMEAYATTEVIQTTSTGGITFGYDDIIANYKRYFPSDRMGQLFFDEVKYRRLSTDLYLSTGRFNLKFKNRDELAQGWFSVVMKKIKEEWLIISDHSS